MHTNLHPRELASINVADEALTFGPRGMGPVDEDAIRQAAMDAGSLARDRMTVKQAALKAARFVRTTIIILIALAIIAIGYGAYYAWQNRHTSWLQDTRNCSAKIGDLELKGQRTYTYPFTEVLGFRMIDTKQIEETTKVFITGTGMSIMGLVNATDDKDASYWGTQVSDGVRDGQMLKPADTYVFMSGKNMGAVDYKSFCR